jgi:hypothetical protein
MADVDRDALPTVDEAKARQEETRARPEQAEDTPKDTGTIAPEVLDRFRQTLKGWHEEDMQKLDEQQQEELSHATKTLDLDRDERLSGLDRQHQAALDRYDREHRIERRGFMGWIANLWDKITPGRAAAEARAREEARQGFINGLAQERATQAAEIQSARDMELSDLAERHAQSRREQETQFQDEFSRRVRDYEEAQKLLARLAAEQPLKTGAALTDAERADMQRRITEKDALERKKYKAFHRQEYRQLRHILDEELKQKLKAFNSQQEIVRQNFIDERRKAGKGIDGFIDARRQRLNPGEAHIKSEANDQEWDNFFAQFRRDRLDQLIFLRQEKREQLDILREIQAQRLRRHAEEIEKERARYLREEERLTNAQGPPSFGHTR